MTPWTVAHHAPLSMGFPRQEYWSGLLFPSLGDLPDPGIELMFPALAGGFFMAEPVNSKRLHFQTPSHWELGFSAWTLAGRQSSAYSRDLSSCPLVAQLVKNLPANAGDVVSIPGSGRSPREGHGNPLQYSCLGNPMDRGAWWATVHGVAEESDST